MTKHHHILSIGIVGGGFVGRATYGFKNSKTDVIIYDLQKDLCIPNDSTMSDIYKCDIVFVAVPTPMSEDGSCYTKIVEDVVSDLKANHIKNIFVRSTVPVGTCNRLGVHFMPEFLTEKNWAQDFYNCPLWIIGADSQTVIFRNTIQKILDDAREENMILSSKIMWVTTMEAELIKYTRNCFLATKVGFFNEIYSLCEKKGIDFDLVREGVTADPRIGPSHSRVPNKEFFNGRTALKKGFGGTCLCKEIQSMRKQYELMKVPAIIMDAVWHRNITIDRPERDWENDKGRAVI